MIKLKDIRSDDDSFYISLKKLSGMKIKDILGSISNECGEVTFSIHKLIMEDGTRLCVGNEHDFAYIEDDFIGQESMENLYEEWEKEDEEM